MALAAARCTHKRSTGELVVVGDGEDVLDYFYYTRVY
jgi:hypothetical protein